MDTQPRTPQTIFHQPQRLIVPLFQRPYVWNEDMQWRPLWDDVVRITERYLADQSARHQPHFLGAVVVQQSQNSTGSMQERTVIDGQQRLTTLQIMLDAIHAEFVAVGAAQPAKRMQQLVENDEAFCEAHTDRFKVWPTNKDRPAFNEVMSADLPVDYTKLEHRGERLSKAHRFFAESTREWLVESGEEAVADRAAALDKCVRELLQMVVIDLNADENAQEIFETLNARGAVLTAADLIKNFVFQRLMELNEDVETVYERFWSGFEQAFWEKDISLGKTKYPRSAVFLNHWLIAQTGEQIVAREVFSRFKRYADFECGVSMLVLVERLHDAAAVYRQIIEHSNGGSGSIDRLGLFAYRTTAMESEVVKPLLLHLLDPELDPIPDVALDQALTSIESWMVRRMLARVTTKSYTQAIAELIADLRSADRGEVGATAEAYFASQTATAKYWPDDDEIRRQLSTLAIYRRLSRARLRMVLEGIEDHFRGWKGGGNGLGGERVARGPYTIEHILPQGWIRNWPLAVGAHESDREAIVNTLGNLTLLTQRLNSKVSNGAWLGDKGKRQALGEHDVLLLNRRLLETAVHEWTDADIAARTAALTEVVLAVWPVPQGHRSSGASSPPTTRRKVDLIDLLEAGLLEPGLLLHARGKKHAGRTATLMADGSIDVDGKNFDTPSGAAESISSTSVNGWKFFDVDPISKRSLSNVWHEYVDSLDVDADDSEVDTEDEVD